MTGLAITFGCILLGSIIAAVDPVAGVFLIVVGGVGGAFITWVNLS